MGRYLHRSPHAEMERNSGIPSLADPLPFETFKCVSYRIPFRLVGEPNKTLGRPYLYKT